MRIVWERERCRSLNLIEKQTHEPSTACEHTREKRVACRGVWTLEYDRDERYIRLEVEVLGWREYWRWLFLILDHSDGLVGVNA